MQEKHVEDWLSSFKYAIYLFGYFGQTAFESAQPRAHALIERKVVTVHFSMITGNLLLSTIFKSLKKLEKLYKPRTFISYRPDEFYNS